MSHTSQCLIITFVWSASRTINFSTCCEENLAPRRVSSREVTSRNFLILDTGQIWSNSSRVVLTLFGSHLYLPQLSTDQVHRLQWCNSRQQTHFSTSSSCDSSGRKFTRPVLISILQEHRSPRVFNCTNVQKYPAFFARLEWLKLRPNFFRFIWTISAQNSPS